MDLRVAPELQASAAPVDRGDDRHPVIMANVAYADILSVTFEISIPDHRSVDDLEKPRSTAQELGIGPAGFSHCRLKASVSPGQEIGFARCEFTTLVTIRWQNSGIGLGGPEAFFFFKDTGREPNAGLGVRHGFSSCKSSSVRP
ncbi:hypothetical protein R0J92_16955 [Tritonibacter sp. SIMBA_163]